MTRSVSADFQPLRPIAPHALANVSRRELRRLGNKAVALFRSGQSDKIPKIVGSLATRFAQRLAASDLSSLRSGALEKLLRAGDTLAHAAAGAINYTTEVDGRSPAFETYDALMRALLPLAAERTDLKRLTDDVAAAGRAVHALEPRIPHNALPLPEGNGHGRADVALSATCSRAKSMATATKSPVYFIWNGAPLTAFPPGHALAGGDQTSRLYREHNTNTKQVPASFVEAHRGHARSLELLRKAEAARDVEQAIGIPATQYAEFAAKARAGQDFFIEAMVTLKAADVGPFVKEVLARGRIPVDRTGDADAVGALKLYDPDYIEHQYGFADRSAIAVWENEQARARP